MSLNPYFGWELLWKLVECDIKNAADVLVTAVHWMLIKNSFSCLGTGDDKVIREDDIGSEVMPCDWNKNDGCYSLRYLYNSELYILHCVIIDCSTLLINLLNVTKGIVSNINFEVKEAVRYCRDDPKCRLQELIPKIDEQVHRVKKELVEPVACHTKLEMNVEFCEHNRRNSADVGTSTCDEYVEPLPKIDVNEPFCSKEKQDSSCRDTSFCANSNGIPKYTDSPSTSDFPRVIRSRHSLPYARIRREFIPASPSVRKLHFIDLEPPEDCDRN